MRRWRAPLLVGLVGVAAVAAFVVLFGTVQRQLVPKGQGWRVHADFEDVAGLAGHSRVTIAGIPVGTIDAIELVGFPDGSTRARVTLRLKDDVVLWGGVPRPDGTAANGATVTRRTATMLGDYYLDITPGLGGRQLQDGDVIPNVVGDAGIMALASRLEKAGDLVPRMQQIADHVESITRSLDAVLGGASGRDRLDKIASDVGRAAEDVALMTDAVKGFVGRQSGEGGRLDHILANVDRFTNDAVRFSGGSADSLERTVRNVEAITLDLRKALEENPGADTNGVQGAVGKLHSALGSLDEAARHLNSVAAKIDGGQGTVGRLVNDDKLINRTEQVVDDVGGLVKSVARLETQIGVRSEFYVNERAFKNYLTLRLQPRPDKYYLLEVVFDPRGKTSVTNRTTVTNDPTKPGVLNEQITETTDSVKVSAEFAKRWAFLGDRFAVTGRFGLIESTGGLGLDLGFFKDSLKFGFDLFDFNADKYPRLRFMASWAFIDHLYVGGGIDDIMNGSRDYFVGAGFRFTDEDLKALLIVAPKPNF